MTPSDIEALLAELKDDIRSGEVGPNILCRRLDKLAAALRECAEDAERYLWLRDGFVGVDFNYGQPPASVITFYWPDAPIGADLGASIDAARREGRK